jgi:hypothetical protein
MSYAIQKVDVRRGIFWYQDWPKFEDKSSQKTVKQLRGKKLWPSMSLASPSKASQFFLRYLVTVICRTTAIAICATADEVWRGDVNVK